MHAEQTMQLTKMSAPKESAMIESTIPAVAIPFGVFFFPEIPNASPTIPKTREKIVNHPVKRKTMESIPSTREATESPFPGYVAGLGGICGWF